MPDIKSKPSPDAFGWYHTGIYKEDQQVFVRPAEGTRNAHMKWDGHLYVWVPWKCSMPETKRARWLAGAWGLSGFEKWGPRKVRKF